MINIPSGAAAPLSLPAPGLDLAATLDCGQCFHWQPLPDGSFLGHTLGHAAVASHRDGMLCILPLGAQPEAPELFWRKYFDLDRDYAGLREQMRAHPVLRQAADYAPGIHILRQPLWEATLAFLLSSNNNIPRIRGIIERLCRLLGAPLPGGQFAFPTPQALSRCSVEQLAPLRCGYRAPYLLDAAARFSANEISEALLSAQPLDRARETLRMVKGIGPKVAECILLFGAGRLEACPVDVWIRRAMETYFPAGLPECCAGAQGLAQQFLFHWMRRPE